MNSWYPIENVINSAYRKVLDFKENAEKILEKEKLIDLSNTHCPEIPSRELLLDVMSPVYLFLLNYSIYISKCIDIPLCIVPSEFLRYRLLNPMLLATQGSIGTF